MKVHNGILISSIVEEDSILEDELLCIHIHFVVLDQIYEMDIFSKIYHQIQESI